MDGIAEHPANGLAAAQEMNLKTVRLLTRTWFGIDTPDVGFRVGISSFFHSASIDGS
ncbi:MAG TPA: hypothetical protein VGQ82_06750 [Chthoniobacterales bacterium]|nr:hypothetical protein [Chthoniobacterales bacterium]